MTGSGVLDSPVNVMERYSSLGEMACVSSFSNASNHCSLYLVLNPAEIGRGFCFVIVLYSNCMMGILRQEVLAGRLLLYALGMCLFADPLCKQIECFTNLGFEVHPV